MVRFRWALAAVWAVVTVAVMLALPALGSEVNSDPSLFLSAAARSVQAASLGAPLLGDSKRSQCVLPTSGANCAGAYDCWRGSGVPAG